MPVFRVRPIQNPGHEEAKMLEYLISGANLLGLAGCSYVVYAILQACAACAQNADHPSADYGADHGLLFGTPSVDYYI